MLRKLLFALGLTLLVSVSSPVFAIEENDLPYVEDLGYEVNLGSGTMGENITDLSIKEIVKVGVLTHDSGWNYYLGGKWRHGVGTKYVWSHFDHKTKVHKTSVKGKGDFISTSGWTDAGKRASASWEKGWWGNKAYADVK